MKTFLFSCKNAINGIRLFYLTQKNGRIEMILAILVILVSFCFQISNKEWVAVLICIALVLISEMLNSAIEKACDVFHPTIDERIKYIKDVSASATLIAALISLFVATIIFIPYFTRLIKY